MPSNYPAGYDSFATHHDDSGERVTAGDINGIQDAVVAVQHGVGLNPIGSYVQRPAGSTVSAAPLPFVNLKDFITTGTTFDVAALVGAMEAQAGFCYVPPGSWIPNAYNVGLDSAISDNTGTARSRFTYKFIGAGKHSRLQLPSGMANTDFLFVANSSNTGDFMAHPKVIFEDFAVSGLSGSNGSFFKANQRSFAARRLYFSSLLNALYATGYSDLIRIEQVYAEAMTSGGWVYTGVNNGDGLVVDQLMAYASAGINLNGCRGASIRSCISGWHQFKNCDVTFDECHFEGDGTINSNPLILIKGGNATVRSGTYYTTRYRPAITVDDESQTLRTRLVIDENVNFMQRLDSPSSSLGSVQGVTVDIVNASKSSEFTFRRPKVSVFGQQVGTGGSDSQPIGPLVTASGDAAIQTLLTQNPALCGAEMLIIYTNAGWTMTPPHPYHLFLQTLQTNATFLAVAAVSSSAWAGDLATGTYYYKAWIRDLVFRAGGASSEVSVTTDGTSPLPQLTINAEDAPVSLRIVRGTSPGSYTHWVNIPITKEVLTLIDQGSAIAGQTWKTTGFPGIPATGGVGETRDGYLLLSTRNAVVWGTSAPTSGNYIVGDICWNKSVTAGGTPGWLCTAAGNPGTWKAMASIAA